MSIYKKKKISLFKIIFISNNYFLKIYRFLQDINVKPMAPGDLLTYQIDTEIVFCILIKPCNENPSYFRCLEKAFQKMKSQLTGYRYLGVQQDPLNHNYNLPSLSRNLYLLKTIFSNRNAEIWVCGDTEQHKELQYQQYKKIVSDAIQMNQKRNSKTNAKTRNKSERKKHSTNGSTSKRNLTENYYCKTPDGNTLTCIDQEQISIDNYITGNYIFIFTLK